MSQSNVKNTKFAEREEINLEINKTDNENIDIKTTDEKALAANRIYLKNISQSFSINDSQIHLFRELSLSIEQGQSYAITGPSGSGKSSLLMLTSGLEKPSTGEAVFIDDSGSFPISDIRDSIGFIFQQFHLLPELTALNNVALPLKLRGVKNAEQKATTWLDRVGLGHRLNHKPQQMSGGEQQRVAIARALVFEPKFIFADEPTGNLDAKSAAEVADILFSCCQEKGAGLVLVTHSNELAARAEHVFALNDGSLKYAKTAQQKAAENTTEKQKEQQIDSSNSDVSEVA